MGRHPSRRRACRNMPAETFVIRAAARAAWSSNEAAPGLRQAQGRALCHLLRELQQHRHRRGGARGAGQERCGDRGRLSALLRHAASSSWAISTASPPAARQVPDALLPWVDKGYDVIALTPSCALMLKFEWPLILPKDPAVERLVAGDLRHLRVRRRHRQEAKAWRPGLQPIEGGVSVHLACHARAQNMGAKAAEMLRLVPKTRVAVIERCRGHGGIWGARTENFETAVKVGKPAAQAAPEERHQLRRLRMPAGRRASDAGDGNDRGRADPKPSRADHPIELMAPRLWADGDSHDPPTRDRSLPPSCRSPNM